MEDGFARDGVLARCDEDANALTDEECATARRAAAAVALDADRRARQTELERVSEVKLLALRERDDRRMPGEQNVAASSVPAFGAPVGTVMPTMQGASFDVYADGSDPFSRRAIEVEAQPPANSFEIAAPELTRTDLAIVRRPFPPDDAARQ